MLLVTVSNKSNYMLIQPVDGCATAGRGQTAVTTRIPGYDVSVDPYAIVKVEIGEACSHGTPVRIYLESEDEPQVIEFATREDAVAFYETLWALRIRPTLSAGDS